MAYVYALCHPNTNEIRYVGKTIDIHKRYKQHVSGRELSFQSYKSKWVNSLLRCGLYPKMVVLEADIEDTQIDAAERYWIAELFQAGCKLTNLTEGGEGGNTLISDEVRKKHAEHTSTGLRGRVRTKEHCDAISRGKAGKPVHTDAHKQELRENSLGSKNNFYGKHHTPGAVEKLRLASTAQIEKNRAKNGGKAFTDEQLKAMSNRFKKSGKYYGVSKFRKGFRCRIYKDGQTIVEKRFMLEDDAARYWDEVIGNFFDVHPMNFGG